METVKRNGETATVRSNRIRQVQEFIASGEPKREIPVDECEAIGTVRATLYNTINSRPFFKKRCLVEQRNYRIFLVRREYDG